MTSRARLILPVLCLLIAACGPATRQGSRTATVTVAAAADLKFALDELLGEFRRDNPAIEVRVTYGSSGNFFTQIANGAAFDLFMSADVDYPARLIAGGHADADSLFLYAVGQIVLWAPSGAALDPSKHGMDALKHPSVRKVAIANPKHAPYGRAAQAALKSLGVYSAVEEKLVLGENIAQTAQFVETGAADAAIIALSLALAPQMRDKGRYWQIPLDAYPLMEQGGCIVSSSKSKDAARLLRAFITDKHGREVLKRYGFIMPERK